MKRVRTQLLSILSRQERRSHALHNDDGFRSLRTRAESPLHGFLKNVGMAFLYNQGCFMVETEVKLNHVGLRRFMELDNHSVIDVCGVGEKFFPHVKKRIPQEDYDGFELENPHMYEYSYNILRGLEVKVSRSDFRNGFVCSGCNYHYVLTPMRLVSPHEVPKVVGLVEYNKYKFSCELTEDGTFNFEGLRVIKRPIFRRIPQFEIDHVIANIARRSLNQDLKSISHEIKRGMKEGMAYHIQLRSACEK